MSPEQHPPPRYQGTPHRYLLREGTTLTRIHGSLFGAGEFNPTVASSPFGGGRFDSTPGDEYGCLYASEDDATAVCETLLRDLPADDYGSRILPDTRLRGLRMSRLRTTYHLELVALRTGKDLAAIGQDTWLTAAPASKYAATRQWATAIRTWSPWAAGLTWRSHREPEGFAYVFFGDRCPNGCFEEEDRDLPLPHQTWDLDDGPARLYIEEILTSYRVVLTR
ncbi:MAG: RES family NAD+ phosphorylase [bacterium]|nr:RES family NAD+ phosphorylase [bacterium]